MSNVVRLRPITGFICMATRYEFKGYFFEFKPHTGVFILKKDGEISKRQPSANSKFWVAFDLFLKLSDKEQHKFKVDGGCIPI